MSLLTQAEATKQTALKHRVSSAASQLDDAILCLKAASHDLQIALGAHAGKNILNQSAAELPQATEKSEAIAQALAALPEEALKAMITVAREQGLLTPVAPKQEAANDSAAPAAEPTAS